MTEQNNNIEFKPLPKDPRFVDITGQTFGRLTVIGYAGAYSRRRHKWYCRCICRRITSVVRDALLNGHTRSCGCLVFEPHNVKHGEKQSRKTSPEYTAFCTAKQRCIDPNVKSFKSYGGRGIQFRFESFADFLREVGRRPTPKHSLDRIDVNGHYEKGNIRWATRTEQGRNKRTNRKLQVGGKVKCISEWAELVNITHTTIHNRLKRGWCIECSVLPKGSHCLHRVSG